VKGTDNIEKQLEDSSISADEESEEKFADAKPPANDKSWIRAAAWSGPARTVRWASVVWGRGAPRETFASEVGQVRLAY
jgi:hypothetical protein